jgi:pheromone alpha factor receptor
LLAHAVPCSFQVSTIQTYLEAKKARLTSNLAIFAILEVLDWTDGRIAFPEASSLTLTLTAIFLPFSSVFVSMKMDEFSSRHGSLMRNMWDGPETKFGNKTWNSSSTHDRVTGIELADRSGNKTTTVASRSEPAHRRDSTELDLEALGVRVDKSYSVRSGH